MDLDKICNEVKTQTRSVGEYLKMEQAKLKRKDVELKGTRNYVTYIDKEAENLLVGGLQLLLPESGFLTEEGTVAFEKKEFTWVIDPLDGTSNYVHGDTTYSVSIALMQDDETVLGVVYNPVLDQMFTAAKAGGAFLNDTPITVSNHASIENGYFGFGIPYRLDEKGEQVIQRSIQHFQKCSFRIKGSAALDLCDVASGVTDAFFHPGLSPWDVAAGAFILACAGGKCTDFSGGNNYIFGREMVASNSIIHDEVMNSIISPPRRHGNVATDPK